MATSKDVKVGANSNPTTQKKSAPAQPGRAQAVANIQPRIDADKLLQFIGSDNVLRWLQDYYRPGESWRKQQGKRYRSKDNKISLSFADGVWFGVDFTSELPNGNPIAILQADKHLSYPEAIKELAREFNYQPGDTAQEIPHKPRRRPQKPAKPAPAYKVNHNKETHPKPSISANWELATNGLELYPKKIDADYLRKYGISPLKSVTWLKSDSKQKSKPHDPLFLIEGAGKNRKIYRPKVRKGQPKHFTATHTGNYCFGFDQLPKRCKHILICAGQNDTIAANMLMNHEGIFAVCLWSESGASYLHPKLLEALQSRCDSVLVAYDDDATGNRTARELEALYNLDALYVPHRFGVNDFCDALEITSRASIVRAVQEEIQALKPHTITGNLSDHKRTSNALIAFTDTHTRCQLKAPTGIGKTFWVFKALLPHLEKRKQPLIFAVPTQSIAEQVQRDYPRKGQYLPLIMQGSDSADFAAVQDSPAVIVTYNSLHKLKDLYPGAVLVVDESHHIFNDASTSFNFRSCNDVLEAFDQVERVITISGTPHDLIKNLGFRFFQVDQTDTAPIYIHARNYKGKLFDNIFAHLEGLTYKKSKGLHCVFWDDKKKLIQLRDALVSTGVLKAEQIAILDSERKREGDYISIKNTGKVQEKTRLILTTRLIADGVNIYNKPGDILLADVKNRELFVQFPARFRRAKAINVYSYRRDRESTNGLPVSKSLELAYKSATARLNEVQAHAPHAAKESHTRHIGRLKYDDFARVYLSRDGVYTISDALIYHEVLKRKEWQTGTAEFYESICSEFAHFKMHDQAEVEAEKDELLEAAKKAIKRKKKQAEKHLERELKHDADTVLAAVYDDCDHTLKKQIEEVATPGAVDREKVIKFKKENADALELRTYAPVKRFVRLRAIGFDNANAAKIVKDKDKGKLSIFHDKLIYQTWVFLADAAPQLLTAKEQAQAKHYSKLYEKLDKQIGVALTNQELVDIMQPVCPRGLTPNKAVMQAHRLYEVKRSDPKINGKTVTKYTLEKRINLADVLRDYGLSVGDYLAKNRLKVEKNTPAKIAKSLIYRDSAKLNTKESNFSELLTDKFASMYGSWWASPGAVCNK